MSTFLSKLTIPRLSRLIRPVRYMHSTFSNSNTNNTKISQEKISTSFPPRMKGVCVALTSTLNSPAQVKHSSLYTDKGYRYLCFKLADFHSAHNPKWTSHIFSVLDQPEELTEIGLLFHLMLPQPKDYLSALLTNWESSELYQSNKFALKGIIIDRIQSNHNTHNENVTVGVSSIPIQLAPNQSNELLLLNLSNGGLPRDLQTNTEIEIRKETAPMKLSYKSVLHNFLDFIDT